MSLELLKKNISQERILVARLGTLVRDSANLAGGKDKIAFNESIESAKKQIGILNDSIPELVRGISFAKPLAPTVKENPKVLEVSHDFEGGNLQVGILKGDRGKYLKELHISDKALRGLRKHRKKEKKELVHEFKKPRGYIKLANRFFGRSAGKAVDKGKFKKMSEDLRKGNFTMLTKSYVSALYFTTFLFGFVGIFLTLFFMFIGLSFEAPYFYFVDFGNTDILLRLVKVFWFIPLVPILTFLAMYFYPAAEKASLKGSLDYELPFATIQMSAIAGADIEPSNIFRIIALNREYPAIRNESKKLMNQINLYGYDLTTSLRNVAAISPSKSWAELLTGISTALRSGGNLSKYLSKKAESLLFEYRIKREKATKSAETFMDIYISVVIAAPMLMMLLLIMINISNLGFSLPIPVLSIIVVAVVALINVIFLVFLHMSQKKI